MQWGKSQILKSPLLFPDLGHTMKNNCAETWRETGCGAGRSFSTLKAQLSHHVLNAPPCPHSTNKGFPRKPPKEAESCTFKEETKGQGEKNVTCHSSHPRGWECSSGKRPHPQNTEESSKKLVWPFIRYTTFSLFPLSFS